MLSAKVIATMVAVFCQLESGDNPNVPDSGDAVGVGHVKTVVVDEVNRLVGYNKWKYSDRRNPIKCRAIMFEYLKLKVEPWMSMQGIALMYKKGPDGMWRDHSQQDISYAERFENLMKKELK